MAIVFSESAGKHGFTQSDAIHAITHAVFRKMSFDMSRTSGGPAPDLYVGPARSGLTIEVMAYTRPPRTLVIFHVMELRPKYRARMDQEGWL